MGCRGSARDGTFVGTLVGSSCGSGGELSRNTEEEEREGLSDITGGGEELAEEHGGHAGTWRD